MAMPSSPRSARLRASTRERIVAAALDVLESEGPSALTIRRIAADVEYTPPVVYQHFANKDALVLELVAHGYGLMVADLQRAAGEHDPDRRLRDAAATYVRFAAEHPHLYEVMSSSAVDAHERRRAAAPAIALLRDLLDAWTGAHAVVLADADEACEVVWGTLSGMAALGELATVGTRRAQALAEQALGAILLGWRTAGSTSL
jgi:AcrR family transcriptional regulator